MAVHIAEQMEPLPGYKLIERLGGGGFGEVWKSTAPGGLLKAIKFVHGNLGSGLDGDLTARQEFKALQRVKDLHHPFILSLERVDVVDGQLLIVMELADRNLWDRFQECRSQGLPGIPRDELLRYMTESAEALDLMNQEFQVQHLDIKPQNLFLIRRHVKVADFGLAKDMDGTHAALTSGITPIYAAPETFEGQVSRFCDQYSLAIVYQELLTGQRPFNGKNARQLLLQHLRAEPNVESLPEVDRAAVTRALAKSPTQRFASCTEFIKSLPRTGPVTLPPTPSCAEFEMPPPRVASPSAETKSASPTKPMAPKIVFPPKPAPEPAAPRPPAVERPTLSIGDSSRAITPAPKPAPKAAPPEPPKARPKAQTRACPRCGRVQKRKGSLGVCPSCGYCPRLDEEDPAKTYVPVWVYFVLALSIGTIAAMLLW
jgi:serine/threonine protein kinase